MSFESQAISDWQEVSRARQFVTDQRILRARQLVTDQENAEGQAISDWPRENSDWLKNLESDN